MNNMKRESSELSRRVGDSVIEVRRLIGPDLLHLLKMRSFSLAAKEHRWPRLRMVSAFIRVIRG